MTSKRAIRTSRKRAEAMSKSMLLSAWRTGYRQAADDLTARIRPTDGSVLLGIVPASPVVLVPMAPRTDPLMPVDEIGTRSGVRTQAFEAVRYRWEDPGTGTRVEWWGWRPA